MTIKALFPSSEPALELDFANTKALDARVSFTRASTGTYVGADGSIKIVTNGVPRFDHNPVTLESLGCLVEEARTNVIRRSTDLTDAWWNKFNVTLSKETMAGPGGFMAYDKVTLGTFTNSAGGLNSYIATTPGVVYSNSIYVKQGTCRYVYLAQQLSNSSNLGAYFDLQTGTGINGGFIGASDTTVTPAGNGWYRIQMKITDVGPGGSSAYNFYPMTTATPAVSGSGFRSYDGNGEYLYIYAPQVENGGFPTSYIPNPTTTAAVTRAADVATVSNTNSSIFPTSSFTTINSPFGTAGGGSTVKLVGPTIKRTAIYNGDLPQSQINALTGTDQWWRWRVTGATFALPGFSSDGNITVDWGDGVVETLTTGVHTFLDSNVYHTIGFRQNSGTFFRPYINNNATYKNRVVATGPAPASMKFDPVAGFYNCNLFRAFDGAVDTSGRTSFQDAWGNCSSLVSFPFINTTSASNLTYAWIGCSSLTSFPQINTAATTSFYSTWRDCSGLTSFPLINTGAGTLFQETWQGCSGLTSFPLINIASATNLANTWTNCTGLTSFPLLVLPATVTSLPSTWSVCTSLTSFPLIGTGLVTSFNSTWRQCSGLTLFPLINTGAGTAFFETWRDCTSLTSFPAINFSTATTLDGAWRGCSALASFPANMFNTTGTLVSTAFSGTFVFCALTAISIENILTSLVTNGQSNITLGLEGGTNAGASTWTANAIAAYNTLISRGWTITRNA